MQYLKMAQTVRQLVGMQGTGPSDVNATGAEGMFLVLVQNAWKDIQTARKKWKWMRDEKSFATAIGTTAYTPLTIFGPNNRFKSWYKDTFYITIDGKKHPLWFREYDYFKYKNANVTTQSSPNEFTIRPYDSAILINPPDSMYSITADYKKSIQNLVAASDEPEMPSDYHDLIVYEAVKRYGISIGMIHIYQEYEQNQTELWGSLLRDQLPREIFKVRGIV